MKLKPDVKLRNQWFTGEAMSHPAKGHLGLWWELIERYTEPGQTILDPMAGIGSTLIACLMGRNVVCNEMETHFLVPMVASWEKMQRGGSMLGYSLGDALIIRGDALSLPLASADAIITSPPWETTVGGDASLLETVAFNPDGSNRLSRANGKGYTHPVSAVITSPPWEDIVQSQDTKFLDKLEEKRNGSRFQGGNRTGYTRPVSAVITSPPWEDQLAVKDIDFYRTMLMADGRNSEAPHVKGIASYTRPVNTIISSPPYEGAETRDQYPTQGGYIADVMTRSYRSGVHSGENIGNLRGEKYWEAMTAVYRECYRVLIPGGVMVLVVKGFTRAKKYQDLPQQTADLLESLGFQVFDRWTREVPLSFWRTLQKQNGNWDEALRYEHVIAARKCHQVAAVGDMMAGGAGSASNTRREKL